MTESVLYEVSENIATITMNRPEVRNSFNRDLGDRLLDALERAEADRDVRAIILTGAGGNFNVGRDNGAAEADTEVLGSDVQRDRTKLLRFTRLVTFMYEMNTPIIGEIRGGCAGAGMSLALNCDFRFVATDTVMSTAFVKVAVGGDMGSSWLLTRVVGPVRARELMLLSPKLRGQRIVDYGLASGVFAPEQLALEVRNVARQLAGYSPTAVAAIRRNLQAALTVSLGDYLPMEGDRLMVCATSPDAEEARLAFVEKRAPQFGRAPVAASRAAS